MMSRPAEETTRNLSMPCEKEKKKKKEKENEKETGVHRLGEETTMNLSMPRVCVCVCVCVYDTGNDAGPISCICLRIFSFFVLLIK